MEKIEPLSKRISLKRLNLEVDSEINQIESPVGEEQAYISTSTDLYSFKPDGSGLRKILSPPEGLEQFAVLTSKKQLIYLSEGQFHFCDKEGKGTKTIPVESETILNAVRFLLSPSQDKVAFVAESEEPDAMGSEIPKHRICLLDLKTGTANLLSDSVFSTIPKLINWLADSILVLNEDSGKFLIISTKDRSERVMSLSYSSVYKGGSLESVAISQDSKYVAFSISYPIERVQIFIQEDRESRMIYELEGEGGFSQALLWSPNSKWLSYVNTCFPAPVLYLISTTSEKPEAVEADTLGSDSKLAWLSKGDGLVYSDGKEVHILKSSDLTAQ